MTLIQLRSELVYVQFLNTCTFRSCASYHSSTSWQLQTLRQLGLGAQNFPLEGVSLNVYKSKGY